MFIYVSRWDLNAMNFKKKQTKRNDTKYNVRIVVLFLM